VTLQFGYDLRGNRTHVTDALGRLAHFLRSQKERVTHAGISGTLLGVNPLDPAFGYDPLYRLGAATGREHTTGSAPYPWDDVAPYGSGTSDPTSARAYTHTYDLQGNALELQHVTTGGSFTRTYGLEEIDESTTTNRLSALSVGSTTFDYTLDAAGQLVRENTERHHVWDAGGRPRARVLSGLVLSEARSLYS